MVHFDYVQTSLKFTQSYMVVDDLNNWHPNNIYNGILFKLFKIIAEREIGSQVQRYFFNFVPKLLVRFSRCGAGCNVLSYLYRIETRKYNRYRDYSKEILQIQLTNIINERQLYLSLPLILVTIRLTIWPYMADYM